MSRSNAPNVLAVIPSQKRSLPPVQKSHVLRPLISSGRQARSRHPCRGNSLHRRPGRRRRRGLPRALRRGPGLAAGRCRTRRGTTRTAERPPCSPDGLSRDCMPTPQLIRLADSDRRRRSTGRDDRKCLATAASALFASALTVSELHAVEQHLDQKRAAHETRAAHGPW